MFFSYIFVYNAVLSQWQYCYCNIEFSISMYCVFIWMAQFLWWLGYWLNLIPRKEHRPSFNYHDWMSPGVCSFCYQMDVRSKAIRMWHQPLVFIQCYRLRTGAVPPQCGQGLWWAVVPLLYPFTYCVIKNAGTTCDLVHWIMRKLKKPRWIVSYDRCTL